MIPSQGTKIPHAAWPKNKDGKTRIQVTWHQDYTHTTFVFTLPDLGKLFNL